MTDAERELRIRRAERRRCIEALCHLCCDSGYGLRQEGGDYVHVITYMERGEPREIRQRCWASTLHGLRLDLAAHRANELAGDGG